MSNRDFDAEIKVANDELDVTVARMGVVMGRFIESVADFMRIWYFSEVQSYALNNPEKTTELGDHALPRMKAEIAALQENAKAMVTECLSDDSLWWHRIRGEQTYFWLGKTAPQGTDKAIRRAAGKVTPILENYGYIGKPGIRNQGSGDNRELSRNRQQGNEPLPSWRALDWSEDMKSILKEYDSLHSVARSLVYSIEKLEREKIKSEALDLWNNA